MSTDHPHALEAFRIRRLSPLVRRFGSLGLSHPPDPCDPFELWWNLAPLNYACSIVLAGDDGVRRAVANAEVDRTRVIEAWEAIDRLSYFEVERMVRIVKFERRVWDLGGSS